MTSNADARFELAELLSQRNEHDEAIKLLQAALEAEKEPLPELADRIKVRLGACLLAALAWSSRDSKGPEPNRVSGTAGLPYDTIKDLKGVTQLDKLDKDRA